ncbi:hypothetical protein ABIA33_004816 [Streptacidiphilus sp. MAP12-16]
MPYSDRAQQKRQRLVALERKVYAETATDAEAAEYSQLAHCCPVSWRPG